MYYLSFHPDLWPEAREQRDYFEEHRPGYGKRFLDDFREICNRIRENPERFPVALERPDLRYTLFPTNSPFHRTHKVFFHFDGETALIVCLFPNRRDQKIWQERELR